MRRFTAPKGEGLQIADALERCEVLAGPPPKMASCIQDEERRHLDDHALGSVRGAAGLLVPPSHGKAGGYAIPPGTTRRAQHW